jgi:hypothetical protein
MRTQWPNVWSQNNSGNPPALLTSRVAQRLNENVELGKRLFFKQNKE